LSTNPYNIVIVCAYWRQGSTLWLSSTPCCSTRVVCTETFTSTPLYPCSWKFLASSPTIRS